MASVPTPRTRGFTLVELLVVIGIIAILIAIIMPALTKARQQALIVSCASNERQIMLMMVNYAQEQRGWLPPMNFAGDGYSLSGPDWWRSWDQILTDSLFRDSTGSRDTTHDMNRYKVFACPADELPRRSDYVSNVPMIRSYAVNQSKWAWGLDDSMASMGRGHGYKMPWSAGNDPTLGFHRGEFVRAAKLNEVPRWIWVFGENYGQSTVYSMSSNPSIYAEGAYLSGAVFGTWDNCTMDTSPARFHSTKTVDPNAGGNYAFSDGHVEFFKLSEVINNGAASDNSQKTVYDDHWKWWTKG